MSRSLRKLSVNLFLPVVAGLTGCVDLTPLREQDYERVTLEQLEEAAYADDQAVTDGLVGVLEARLSDPSRIDLDHTLETLASLRLSGRRETAATVRRCAREDKDEDVRYMALEVLVALVPQDSAPILESARDEDESAIVRAHAENLLRKVTPSVESSP